MLESEISGCLDFVFVSVNLDCEFDRVWYHSEGTLLGTSIQVFAERFNCRGKTNPECAHYSMG